MKTNEILNLITLFSMKIEYNNLYTHFVFSTLGRQPLIPETNRIRIEKYITGIINNNSSKLYAIYANPDHVHFLVQSVPTYSVTKIVTIIKSLTAREVFKRCPEVKKQLWGGEFWTDGYFASTVGKHGNEDTIGKYVKNQGTEYQKLHEDRQLSLF